MPGKLQALSEINDWTREHLLYECGKVHSITGDITTALIKVQSPHYWLLAIEHFHSRQLFKKSLLDPFICFEWLSCIEKGLYQPCKVFWDFWGLLFCVLCSKFVVYQIVHSSASSLWEGETLASLQYMCLKWRIYGNYHPLLKFRALLWQLNPALAEFYLQLP